MKTNDKKITLYLSAILMCFFLSSCAYNNSTSSDSIKKYSYNQKNKTQKSDSIVTDSNAPLLNNETSVNVPIQQVYKNEQEAANFQEHMSSVDNSLKEASSVDTNK